MPVFEQQGVHRAINIQDEHEALFVSKRRPSVWCSTRNSVIGCYGFLGVEAGDWCPAPSAVMPCVYKAGNVWETKKVDLFLLSLVYPAAGVFLRFLCLVVVVVLLVEQEAAVDTVVLEVTVAYAKVVSVNCDMVSVLDLSVSMVVGGGVGVFMFH